MNNTVFASDFTAWNSVSPGSARLYLWFINNLAGQYDLSTVSSQELGTYLNNPTWSPNTRTTAFTALKKFFWWMEKVGKHRTDNPMDLISRPKPKRGLPRPVPEDFLESARKKASTARELLMFNLGSLQGLRRAEIATLRIQDIDLDRDLLVVKGKGGKVRELPIHASIRADLERVVRGATSDYVFESPNKPGYPLTPTTVGRKMSKLMDKKYTTHQLRHRFATAVYKSSGNDIRVTQELLGHASVATTQIYTAVSKESMRTAVSGV